MLHNNHYALGGNNVAKLLVIKANPNSTEASFGLTAGQAFVDAYRAEKPDAEITEINLFEEYIPEIDGNMMAAWGALANGTAFTDLSAEQQKQVGASGALLEQFMAHDQYVFITPMWNFTFPARVKSYLDTLCAAGTTFRYTESGPVGLLEGKKALHIHAAGGFYNGDTHADRLLRDILGFIGISDVETLYVEGHNAVPEQAEEIKEQSKATAAATAKRFVEEAVIK